MRVTPSRDFNVSSGRGLRRRSGSNARTAVNYSARSCLTTGTSSRTRHWATGSAISGASSTTSRSGAITLDHGLRAAARRVREAMPCSVQLPAGAGKTQIIAAVGALASEAGERVLVLTHTNAGVDALRRRMRAFGVAASQVSVETI